MLDRTPVRWLPYARGRGKGTPERRAAAALEWWDFLCWLVWPGLAWQVGEPRASGTLRQRAIILSYHRNFVEAEAMLLAQAADGV
jgi:hypothetical protein